MGIENLNSGNNNSPVTWKKIIIFLIGIVVTIFGYFYMQSAKGLFSHYYSRGRSFPFVLGLMIIGSAIKKDKKK